MKINFNKVLLNVDDKPIIKNGKEVVAKDAIVDSLYAYHTGDENVEGSVKMKRFELAQKVLKANKTTEYTVEELNEIKSFVGKYAFTIVIGQIYNLIEGK